MTGTVIDRNRIHDCGRGLHVTGAHDHGIYVAWSQGAQITNNVIYGADGGWGIQLWTSAHSTTLQNNILDGNTSGNIILAGDGSGDGSSSNNTFSQNILSNVIGADGDESTPANGTIDSGNNVEVFWDNGEVGTGNAFTGNCMSGFPPGFANFGSAQGLSPLPSGTVTTAPTYVDRPNKDYNVVGSTACAGTGPIPPDTAIDNGPPSPTNLTNATLAFSSAVGVEFQCKLDAAAYTACSSPASYSGLSDASHTFSVRAVDGAGTYDASSATSTWTVDSGAPPDTTPPNTTIATAPTALAASTSATFTFSSTEAGSSFQCKLDAGAYAACTSPTTYTSLAQGSHTFSVKATDAAANEEASPATSTWTVDTNAPNTTITTGPAASTTSTDAAFTLTSEVGASYECSLDGAAFASCTSAHSLSGLPLGSHTLSARARDAAGNTDATPATWSWTVAASVGTGGGGSGGGGGIPPNLSVVIGHGPSVLAAGDAFTYLLLVQNASDGGSTGVWLEFTLPANAELVSSYAEKGPGCLARAQAPRKYDCFLDFIGGKQVTRVTVGAHRRERHARAGRLRALGREGQRRRRQLGDVHPFRRAGGLAAARDPAAGNARASTHHGVARHARLTGNSHCNGGRQGSGRALVPGSNGVLRHRRDRARLLGRFDEGAGPARLGDVQDPQRP